MCLHLSIFFVLQCFEFSPAVLWTRLACFWIFASALLGFLFEVIPAVDPCLSLHLIDITYIYWCASHSWRSLQCPVWVRTLEVKWNPAEPESSWRGINKHTMCTGEPTNTNCPICKNQYFFLFLFSSNWITLPVHFHLTGFDLSFNGKPGKSDSRLLYSIMCLFLPLCISNHNVNSVVMVLNLQVSKVWPNGDPVLVSVQSIQGPLLVHSQLNVAELSAFRHQLDLYTVTRDLSGVFLPKHSIWHVKFPFAGTQPNSIVLY